MAFKEIKKKLDYHLTDVVKKDGVILLEGFYRKLIYKDNTSIWFCKASYRGDFTQVFQKNEVDLLEKLQLKTIFE